MRRRFLVAIPQNDGGVGLYAMKQWLRQHPEHVPPGRCHGQYSMAAAGRLEKARMVSRCYRNGGADDDARNDAPDASVIPNVSLFEYAVQFHLKPANFVKRDR